jgi:hypothetical protein
MASETYKAFCVLAFYKHKLDFLCNNSFGLCACVMAEPFNMLVLGWCMRFVSVKVKVGAGIAGYGLDGLGIESQCGRDFSHVSRPALGPTHPPIQWVLGLLTGVKWPGRGADHPPPSSAEVKGELSYTSFPPLGLRFCYGVPLP